MSDNLTLAIMASVALSCGLTVAGCEQLYRAFTQQSHGDLTNCDTAVFGDWPSIPTDLKIRNHAERNSL